MTLGFNFIVSGLGTCSALVVSPINNLPGGPVKPFLHLVQNQLWVFTLDECLPEMISLFAEKFGLPHTVILTMGEVINYTKFC